MRQLLAALSILLLAASAYGAEPSWGGLVEPCTSIVTTIFNPTEDDTVTDWIDIANNTTGTNIVENTTEGLVDNYMVPIAVSVSSLRCEVVTNVTNSGDDTAELWDCEISDDGADALSCQITVAAVDRCYNRAQSSLIAAGSKLNLTITSVDDSGGNPPATSAEMWVSFCISPATP